MENHQARVLIGGVSQTSSCISLPRVCPGAITRWFTGRFQDARLEAGRQRLGRLAAMAAIQAR